MAAKRPDPLSRKRKDSISDLKRDQPPASRQVAPSQQPPDFFTESLNSSYIPSPSPVKSPPKRQNVRAKPRPPFGGGPGRSLAAAFKATATPRDEDSRPTSRHSRPSPKPRPSQSDAQPRSSPVNAPTADRAETRTPSPGRGRSISVASPVSSQHSQSSPPRGLAEAYQRIVDEESLADQESAADDMDAYGLDNTDTDLSHQFDSPQSPRVLDDQSPTSLKASRKASREPTPVRDYSENKENALHGSEGESGMTSSENVTDQSLDSAISQYNKDARRINKVVNSEVGIFSKARVGPRVGLTVENLRRNNSSAESLGSGSLRSRGSEPSLNYPKAWGRKSKPEKGWLSRINNRNGGKLTGDVPKKQKADSPIIAESEKREWDEPIDEWIQAAAEGPIPSGENGSSQTPLPSEESTPTMAHKTSKDQLFGWDADADFTARSLQVSDSPPIRTGSSSVGKARDPEIDSVEKRAVTTSRLGALREKSSQDSLGGKSPENVVRTTPRSQHRSSSRSSRTQPGEKRARFASEVSFEEGGDPIPDTPVVVYKNSPVTTDRDTGLPMTRRPSFSQRPSHDRQDSRDILQRLARATSASPAPVQRNAEPRQPETDPNAGPSNSTKLENDVEHSASRRRDSSRSQELEEETATTSAEQDEIPVPSKSSARLKTPQITGGWVDNTILEETPRNSMPSVNLKTPFVTGAWIDTPLPAGGRGPPMPTPNFEDDKDFILEGNEKRKLATSDLIKKLSPKSEKEPLRNSSRPLPKSALESVLKAAKASLEPNSQGKPTYTITHSDSEDDPTLHLGESTIQSLEDILANDTEMSSPPLPPTSEKEDEENQSPQTAEIQPYTRQLSRLSSLLPSIREARRTVAQLERAVASKQALTVSKQPDGECTEAGEFHDFIWPCEKCGCSARLISDSSSSKGPPRSLISFNFKDDMTTLEIPMPRLWRWRSGDWRPRFTWLGLILFVGSSWWLAEGWMCDIYCHPRYAYSYSGYGVDINSPEPPFVLEKMLWRWLSVGTIVRPLYIIVRAIVGLAAEVVGWIVGFGSGGGSSAGEPQPSPPIQSNTCGGCQIDVQYDYATAKNPSQAALYIRPLRYVAKAVQKHGGKCVTDFGFPVDMGGEEILTISTTVNSAGISSVAEKAISQMLGTSLCVTTPYTTINPDTIAPSSTPTPFTATATSTSTTPTQALQPSSTTQTQPRTITATTRPQTSSSSPSSSSETFPQPALAPSSTPPNPTHPTDRNLQIIAGVVTSVLGLAALALAFLLWRRYRLHRRASSSTDGSFVHPKPELESAPVSGSGSVTKPIGSGATSEEGLGKGEESSRRPSKRDMCELAGETGSMDLKWRETYYEERKTIPLPQELRGAEPVRYEMDTRRSRGEEGGGAGEKACEISPLTP
ncbi:MAG: hypothetical protein Q9195_008676 [Heterodermia aff. obscurata]